jgi:hypothetical protein
MREVVGGEVVAAMLATEGVDTDFGIVDGTDLGLFASFKKYDIQLVSPGHETTAAHRARGDAAARAGSTSAWRATAPASPKSNRASTGERRGHPVLLVTSTRRRGFSYPDRGGTYQYFDQCGVVGPMSKWSGAAPSFYRVPEMLRRAFRISWRARLGVVHVDVPENVRDETFEIAGGWCRPLSSATGPSSSPCRQHSSPRAWRCEREPIDRCCTSAAAPSTRSRTLRSGPRRSSCTRRSPPAGAQSLLASEHPLCIPFGAPELELEARANAVAQAQQPVVAVTVLRQPDSHWRVVH